MKIVIHYKGGIVAYQHNVTETRIKEYPKSIIQQTFSPEYSIDEASFPKEEIIKIEVIP